jgi:hypothetical protein
LLAARAREGAAKLPPVPHALHEQRHHADPGVVHERIHVVGQVGVGLVFDRYEPADGDPLLPEPGEEGAAERPALREVAISPPASGGTTRAPLKEAQKRVSGSAENPRPADAAPARARLGGHPGRRAVGGTVARA